MSLHMSIGASIIAKIDTDAARKPEGIMNDDDDRAASECIFLTTLSLRLSHGMVRRVTLYSCDCWLDTTRLRDKYSGAL